ncbi:MAG TPA: zinc ABC transporter substrate-binding protein [Gemmataceae bacterium]|nr:zinc ABC transporter substrate-binding protein [Gemmataceae bacterium]
MWTEAKPGQKKILVSFPPLYSITHAIAGDDAYVLSLLTGKGPHDYEGAPTDLFMVNNADLLIFNGLTLDDAFVNRMRSGHRNKSLSVLNVGDELIEKDHERVKKNQPPLLLQGDGEVHVHADGAMHKHGDIDPHVWLGPDQAIAMTEIIASKLSDIDPSHKKGYETRAGKFIGELKALKEYGKAALKDKKNKNIITMHEAFKYFAQNFDIKIVDSIQVRPGMDPDPAKTKELLDLCVTHRVRVIAIEPQYSRGPAESVRHSLLNRIGPAAKEEDVSIIELDPLETASTVAGKQTPDPDYYLKKMRANIDTLAKKLP